MSDFGRFFLTTGVCKSTTRNRSSFKIDYTSEEPDCKMRGARERSPNSNNGPKLQSGYLEMPPGRAVYLYTAASGVPLKYSYQIDCRPANRDAPHTFGAIAIHCKAQEGLYPFSIFYMTEGIISDVFCSF